MNTHISDREVNYYDYAIANEEAIIEIDRIEIEAKIESDHQPLTLNLTCKTITCLFQKKRIERRVQYGQYRG